MGRRTTPSQQKSPLTPHEGSNRHWGLSGTVEEKNTRRVTASARYNKTRPSNNWTSYAHEHARVGREVGDVYS